MVYLLKLAVFTLAFNLFAYPQIKKVNEFTSSNLPIIVIDTHGRAIVDEPKIPATLGIINNGPDSINSITDPFTDYDGSIGIELRGNSTQNLFPKKPYLFETRDSSGKNLDVSLLGMPEDNDWILLASYIDRTFIRDPLAHYLSALMGRWSSRCRFCEVIVNNEYMGVYILTEKIKRGKNRVDIKKLEPDDTSNAKITGGYIYEVTGFGGDFGENRLLHYPKPEDITEDQLNYIKNYDDNFRISMLLPSFSDSVNGYEKWINTDSFIDEILIQEFMRNSDAYGWSAYFHKNRDEKLQAGPAWDFDQSSGNSSLREGEKTSGWVLDYGGYQPFFWKILFKEKRFNSKLRLRWNELRKNNFSDKNILSFIDSCGIYLEQAQERNFEKWPVLGVFTWRETIGYQNRDTYQKEVDYLKSYMTARADWMDNQLKLETTGITSDNSTIPDNFYLGQNFPNPFNPATRITYVLNKRAAVQLKVYDMLGREIKILVNEVQNPGKYSLEFNAERLGSGIYFYRIAAGNNTATRKMVILK